VPSWQVKEWNLSFNLFFFKPHDRLQEKSHRKSISGFPQQINLSLFVVSVNFHVGYLRLLHLSTRSSCSLACVWRASLLRAWSYPLHNILRTVTRCLQSITLVFHGGGGILVPNLLHSLVNVSGIFVSFDRKPYVGFFPLRHWCDCSLSYKQLRLIWWHRTALSVDWLYKNLNEPEVPCHHSEAHWRPSSLLSKECWPFFRWE